MSAIPQLIKNNKMSKLINKPMITIQKGNIKSTLKMDTLNYPEQLNVNTSVIL